jgi:hypothetical protein
LNDRILIASGFALLGAAVAATTWYLGLLVMAPYRQRDDAREARIALLQKLDDKADLEATGEKVLTSVIRPKPSGAFTTVARAIDAPDLPEDIEIGALWAALPDLAETPLFGR